ncbi:MAG: polysaccharide pyruvyl transferase family protein [Chloroflexia bacterium]
MKERKRIVILGWYGSNNTGDEALVQVIVERLREHGFDDLVALSTNPGKTGGRLGVRSVSRNPLNLGTIRAMYGAKALILGGGGLIQDGTSIYNLPIYAMYVALAKLLGLKVVGWGLGAEPLWTMFGRLLARFICHSADYFSVRDSASKQLLVRAGVAPHMVKVTADPAILLRPEQGEDNWPRDGKPTVIFCIRHLPANQPGIGLHYLLPVSTRHRVGIEWRQQPGRVEGLVEGIAGSIKIAVEEFGARVVLLPLWPGRDDEMLDVVEKAAIGMGVPPEMVVRARLEHTPGKFSGYVGKADLLVSMRLHALIFGAAQGVPMIALSYARKVRGFMRELDFERWVVEVERQVPQPEEMKTKLRELWAMREEESRRLAESSALAQKVAASDAHMIVEVVNRKT